ncbi:MAG: type V CRISPR-associated protein Cas4 [Phocaeicola sp.]|nr:type V CRISPR-associated protein Cas4 [Phocaeicola sp.]
MGDYIAISLLNDFVFCPYSIYLHNVYMESDESQYHAIPQTKGRIAHKTVDEKKTTNGKGDLVSVSVCSDEFRIYGKIDLYRFSTKTLIERKYQLKNIYRGQIYQLWAQYFCLCEMGIKVEKLAFYEISTNKMIEIKLPESDDRNEFIDFLSSVRKYNLFSDIIINANKCKHCIYCNLCDKNNIENVYI